MTQWHTRILLVNYKDSKNQWHPSQSCRQLVNYLSTTYYYYLFLYLSQWHCLWWQTRTSPSTLITENFTIYVLLYDRCKLVEGQVRRVTTVSKERFCMIRCCVDITKGLWVTNRLLPNELLVYPLKFLRLIRRRKD